jgi:putative hemolysin
METIVSAPYFVPEAVKADVLFKNMREQKEAIAVVLDEYGGLFGVVTMTDLVECILGDINNETEDGEEELPPVELLSENSWRILGSASIDEVEDALGIKLGDADSDTFSGYALAIYGSVPDDGTNFELTTENLNITIEEIKDHKIDRATVSIKQDDDAEDNVEDKSE